MHTTGMCPGHSGKGIAADPRAHSPAGHAERRRRANTRAILGISGRRAAQPQQLARIRAQERAEDYARAIVDGPLDDGELGTIARQQAAIRALELLYPQVTATVDVNLEEDGVDGLGWQQLQALAAQYSE